MYVKILTAMLLYTLPRGTFFWHFFFFFWESHKNINGFWTWTFFCFTFLLIPPPSQLKSHHGGIITCFTHWHHSDLSVFCYILHNNSSMTPNDCFQKSRPPKKDILFKLQFSRTNMNQSSYIRTYITIF